MRNALCVVFALLSASAYAQTPVDLGVELEMTYEGVTRAHAGESVTFIARVRWFDGQLPVSGELAIDVPGEVTNGLGDPCSGAHPTRCGFTVSFPFPPTTVFLRTKLPSVAGTYTATAALTSSVPDPRPDNNIASIQITVSDAPDLAVSISPLPNQISASAAMFSVVSVANRGATAAHGVVVTVTPTGDATVSTARLRSGTGECTADAGAAICRASVLEPRKAVQVDVTLVAPDRLTGGSVGCEVQVTEVESDFDARDNFASANIPLVRGFVVRNTADSGEGSLRQAILDASDPCRNAPCSISFHIPPPLPESGWFTIALESPLPPMPPFMDLEGASQTVFTGDTNPDGPEIEIRGDRLTEGDGLTARDVCETHVSNLAINGFPGHAIALDTSVNLYSCHDLGAPLPPFLIENNVIGLDPSGKTPVPNLRGIWMQRVSGATIHSNLISGNRRSAIFITNESWSFEITNNRIGVTSDNRPAGNGASGIYIGPTSYGGDILDNVIANSGDFGIARAYDAHEVGMHRNLIYGSGLTAIDAGLDLETPNVADDSRTVSNHPVLFSAFYDPASDTTRIRGRLDSERRPIYPTAFGLEFFASSSLGPSGHAQAERYIGARGDLNFSFLAAHGDFEFSVTGDLRGQWITATASRSHIIGLAKPLSHRVDVPDDTSELSNAVQVTP